MRKINDQELLKLEPTIIAAAILADACRDPWEEEMRPPAIEEDSETGDRNEDAKMHEE